MSYLTKSLTGVAAASLLFVSSAASAGSLNGTKWNTIDDKTGKVRSVVQFKEANGVVSAKIIKLYDNQGKKCTKCTGDLKNKPILGLQFLNGFKETKKNQWAKGRVVDPENGKSYRGRITLTGDELKLKGFVKILGVEVGRSQTWKRAK